MQVQVNTGHDIKGSEIFDQDVQSTIEAALGRFTQLTRVEVHFRDDNSSKSNGLDKRCVLEARPAGMQPVVVEVVAVTVEEALDDAVEKMAKLLNSTFEKLHDHKGRMSTGEAMAVE